LGLRKRRNSGTPRDNILARKVFRPYFGLTRLFTPGDAVVEGVPAYYFLSI
jgi:hypothetical protein